LDGEPSLSAKDKNAVLLKDFPESSLPLYIPS